jgi:hypothetical protein
MVYKRKKRNCEGRVLAKALDPKLDLEVLLTLNSK